MDKSVKIVYILRSFAIKAGTERVISDKMNYLAEQGYVLTLITYEQGKHPRAFPLHPSIQHFDLDTRFFEIDKYGLFRRLYLLFRLRRQFRLRLQNLINKISPDFVISTTYSINLIDIILSLNTQAIQFVESHVACNNIKKSNDYRDKVFIYPIAVLYDNWFLRKVAKADKLVVLTKGDASDWMNYSSNVIIIPNPITFYPDRVLPHKEIKYRILCVGRLQEQKGYDMLIDAFSLIAERCVGWKIEIFGDGPDKEMLKDKIIKLNLVDRIIINSPIANIYDEYQNSDFFVLSSRFEGLPLVLGEAMSCGIPCVSFRCKYGPEDIIRDGQNGLLVEDGNVEELGEKIIWMLSHTKERLRMGEQAREDIRHYEKNVIMQKWVSLFKSYM
jgi:glycosyltransferase involved in cell wall biosynthesis